MSQNLEFGHFEVQSNIILLMLSVSVLEDNDSNHQLSLKQKLYLFQKTQLPRKKDHLRQFSTIQMINPQSQQPFKQNHSALKPKLPSKKLFDDPKFFISLERKKTRIINGLKNAVVAAHGNEGYDLKQKKIKDRHHSSQKRSVSFLEDRDMALQTSRSGFQPNKKTPFLNFNMQYLIRKRKSMTPSLEKNGQRMYQTLSSFRNS